MARIARVVVPGIPHHVTQRGNRRQRTFFERSDYRAYIDLMAEWCTCHDVAVWAYCLMPNHVHLVVVPSTVQSLRRAIGEAHRRYTRGINMREGWTGHLWQGRFASFPMDERHLLAAVRYVELNPVRARLASRPQDYRWSSCRAHFAGCDDELVSVEPLLRITGDWDLFLSGSADRHAMKSLRQHERTGRPLGDEAFVTRLECMVQRTLHRQRPGPKAKRG